MLTCGGIDLVCSKVMGSFWLDFPPWAMYRAHFWGTPRESGTQSKWKKEWEKWEVLAANPLPQEYFLQCTKDNGNMRVNPRKEYLFSDALLYISCSTGVSCPAAFANTILIQCMHAYTWDSQSSVSCIIENMKFIILPQDITFISPSSPFATSSSASYIRFAAIMADINV